MGHRNWEAAFAEKIEDDETIVVTDLDDNGVPKYVVAVKKADMPEIYNTAEVIRDENKIAFFLAPFSTVNWASYRMLFDRQKAQDMALDLFLAATFGISLINLSEIFGIEIGRGWKTFKEMTLPAVQHIQHEE